MLIRFIKYSVKEYLFAYFSLAFLITYWASAHTLPYAALRYPIILSVVASVLVVSNLADSVIKFRRELDAEKAALAEGAAVQKNRWDCTLGLTKKRLGVAAFTLLYPILLPYIGFLPLSLVYLFGVSYFLNIRNYKVMILYSVIITAALFCIFELWLGISLPQGILKGLL